MSFEILGQISDVETFAAGSRIREIADCAGSIGAVAGASAKVLRVRLANGSIHQAELHWYEAAGIGRKEFKIKHLL